MSIKMRPIIIEKSFTSKDGDLSWERVQGAWVGFIQPISGSPTTESGKSAESVSFRLSCPVNVPFSVGWRVTQFGRKYKMQSGGGQILGTAGVGKLKEITLGTFE